MKELVLDVSNNDRGIDLAAWKAKRGLWGVIIKRGGYESLSYGKAPEEYHNDTSFAEHYANATNAGLHVGCYYYSVATDAATMRHNARHLVSLLGGTRLDLPVYIDIEDPAQLALPASGRIAIIDAFCEVVREAGYLPGVYSGYQGLADIPRDRLSDYAMWVAAWRDTKPGWASDYGMWQQGAMRIDGHVSYGDADDHHDFDWCYADYPSVMSGDKKKREPAVTRTSLANEAAEIHHLMVTDPRFGYSQQPTRWGESGGETVTFTSSTGRRYEIPVGDYDCASSVITAWRLALQGTPYEGGLDGATYTGDIEAAFVGSGLFTSSLTPAKRGDLYLRPKTAYRGGHVAMCQDGGNDGVFGYDCLSEFNRNENHTASYGKSGDQDGQESVMRAYYNYPWDTVIHYGGGADPEERGARPVPEPAPQPDEAPEQVPGEPRNDVGIKYRAHCQTIGWCEQVRDGQVAGTTGQAKRLEAIRITPPDGVRLDVHLKVDGIGTLAFDNVWSGNDPVIGTTGQGRTAETMSIRCTENGTGMRLRYQAHSQTVGWGPVCSEGQVAGVEGRRLEAVRIWFE